MMKFIGIGLAAFVLFCVQRILYQRLWSRKLKVTVKFSDTRMFRGESGELVEVVGNRKWLPLPVLKVKFQTDRHLEFADKESSKVTDHFYRNDIFQIGGGERITRKHTFKATRRGYYKILGIELVSGDLFLTTEMVERRKEESFLYVYPVPCCNPQFVRSLRQLNGELLVKRHWMEDPFEYRGIREYQPYDDLKCVNWKATAKTGELKVNQKNYTSQQTVRIFLNAEDTGILKKEDAVELAFCVVAGIASFFLDQGVLVSVYANSVDIVNRDPVRIEAGAGSGQMERIYKALARIDADSSVVPFRQLFGEMLLCENSSVRTVVVAPNAYPDFLDLLREYGENGGEYDWFYPVSGKELPILPDWAASHVNWVMSEEAIR